MKGVSSISVTVVIVGVLMNLVSRGFGETFTVFLLPLEAAFQATRAELTRTYSIFMLVVGLGAPMAGWLFDRFGPRLVYLAGATVLACGFVAASFATSLWHLYIAIGLVAGFGSTLIGVVPASSLARRWFKRRLSTAMGVIYSGLGVGVIALVPLAQYLIELTGWRTAYLTLGLGLLFVVVPLSLLPWHRLAAGNPDLDELNSDLAATEARPGSNIMARLRGSRPDQLAFLGLFNVYFFTSIAVYTTNIQVVAFLVEQGVAPLAAATAFGAAGMLSVFGIIGAGWLSDRLGRLPTVTLTFAFTIAGVISLFLFSRFANPILIVLYVIGLGIFQGARGPMVSTIAADIFGGRNFGVIYGAVTLGMGIGASIGAYVSGWLRDISGGYDGIFALSVVSAIVAWSQFIVIPRLRATAGRRWVRR